MPLSNAQSPIQVQGSGSNINLPQTYMAPINVVGPSGVSVEIRGSGPASIFITKISLNLVASDTVNISKRSANSIGGTSSSVTAVPLNSGNGAANASVLAYTVAPTGGALIGAVAIFTGNTVTYTFGGSGTTQPIALTTAAETLSIDLTAGTTITGFIEWYEV